MSDVDPLQGVVPAGDGDRQSGLPVPEGAVPAEGEPGAEIVIKTIHIDRKNRRYWVTRPGSPGGNDGSEPPSPPRKPINKGA